MLLHILVDILTVILNPPNYTKYNNFKLKIDGKIENLVFSPIRTALLINVNRLLKNLFLINLRENSLGAIFGGNSENFFIEMILFCRE